MVEMPGAKPVSGLNTMQWVVGRASEVEHPNRSTFCDMVSLLDNELARGDLHHADEHDRHTSQMLDCRPV